MYFLVEDDELLEKYTVWDKVSANIKNEFDSEPVYNKKILKTNIKFHGDEVGDFYDKKILRCILIMLVQLGFCFQKRWELLSVIIWEL